MARHVVLLGDSVFDNSAYIDGPDVAEQLRSILDSRDTVTLLAVDGSVSEDVVVQLKSCPAEATHVIVSSGGNDILHHAALLEMKVANVSEALALLKRSRDEFVPSYEALAKQLGNLNFPVAICPIYDANMGPLITTALAIFNDAITRNAHAYGLDIIDLRLVCDEATDYANPIEPSEQGGMKIATAIKRYVCSEGASPPHRTGVFC